MELADIIPAEANEYLIQSQFRMNNPKYDIDNCHDMINLEIELKMVDMYKTLVARQSDERIDIAASGEDIVLSLNGYNSIEFRLNGILLKGKNKVAVCKKILEVNGIIDSWVSDEWETYITVHNDRLYKISFHTGEYGLVASMKPYKPRLDYNEPSVEEYYKVYKSRKTKHNYYTHPVNTHDEIYGDQASGLGSVYTDEIDNQLDEAIDLISKVINDDQFSNKRDILQSILCNAS